ncbi:MAG TPA: DUF6763 family protein [Steroidobacteraceae bacterium]|nr:DUF6763 family protein [Steroidobacteraceae bacterium]
MARLQSIEPIVGDWYRSHGQLFEVIAVDDDEDIIEIQNAGGDLEEIDTDDWNARARAGSLATADPPDDSRGGEDHEDAADYGGVPATMNEIRGVRADAMQDLDLFESGLERY